MSVTAIKSRTCKVLRLVFLCLAPLQWVCWLLMFLMLLVAVSCQRSEMKYSIILYVLFWEMEMMLLKETGFASCFLFGEVISKLMCFVFSRGGFLFGGGSGYLLAVCFFKRLFILVVRISCVTALLYVVWGCESPTMKMLTSSYEERMDFYRQLCVNMYDVEKNQGASNMSPEERARSVAKCDSPESKEARRRLVVANMELDAETLRTINIQAAKEQAESAKVFGALTDFMGSMNATNSANSTNANRHQTAKQSDLPSVGAVSGDSSSKGGGLVGSPSVISGPQSAKSTATSKYEYPSGSKYQRIEWFGVVNSCAVFKKIRTSSTGANWFSIKNACELPINVWYDANNNGSYGSMVTLKPGQSEETWSSHNYVAYIACHTRAGDKNVHLDVKMKNCFYVN